MEAFGDPKLATDPLLHSVLDDVARFHAEAEQIAQRYRAERRRLLEA